MSQAKVADFPLLLEVFREGFRRGLVSKEDIVTWADGIIQTDSEPDYFFIEVSLSGNINTLVTVLNQYAVASESPITLRVLMGIIYQKLINDIDTITVETATGLVGELNSTDILTPFEYGKIYSFEDYEFFYQDDLTQLQVDILNFLSIYKNFNLFNYDQWAEINAKVEETLKEEQVKANIVNDSFKKDWEKREAKRKLKKRIVIVVLVAIALTVIILDLTWFIKGTIHPRGMWYLNMFCVYSGIRWGYAFWKKRRR